MCPESDQIIAAHAFDSQSPAVLLSQDPRHKINSTTRAYQVEMPHVGAFVALVIADDEENMSVVV
jgi:hypothetical protein